VARAVGDPVKDIYIGVDAAIGRILSAVDEDTVVLVYSSFGMGPHYSGTDLLDLILQRLEGRRHSQAKEWMMNAMRQAWRRAPTGLRKSLMPIRRHTWERVYHSSMTPDRSTRRFFEMKTNNATGGVRINLVGRESHGLVQSGAEYDALCGQLTEDLLAMRNADTDEPLVQEVLRTDQIYHGERLSKLPDLLVQWNRSSPIVRATSPKTGFIENRHLSARTGDHKPFGMYIASGSSVQPGRLPAAVSVADLAPMIATILGII
jgi:predicted AlkP superfamily phosphohydrolase/phosphomutase